MPNIDPFVLLFVSKNIDVSDTVTTSVIVIGNILVHCDFYSVEKSVIKKKSSVMNIDEI